MSKPEALRLADEYAQEVKDFGYVEHSFVRAKLENHLAALHAECEALRADAGRWRWLRSRPPETPTNGPDFVLWVECYGEAPRNEKADAAVDAAMAKDRTK